MKKYLPDMRKADLAQIHIGVAALNWTDADYRSVLQSITGKQSSADLDAPARQRFIAHLKKCGWQPKSRAPKLTPQQWRITRLWAELGDAGALKDNTVAALNVFIKHQVGSDHVRFLNTAQSTQITEALKAWHKRFTSTSVAKT